MERSSGVTRKIIRARRALHRAGFVVDRDDCLILFGPCTLGWGIIIWLACTAGG